jgi:predicted ribosomally synthesized peptide with SipW-like signal peptide
VSRHRAAAPRRGFTRVRAVLAGALVLGVGATVTLAAWNDSEYATGSFAASTFNTESSTVNGVWASNTAAPGAALAFGATAMSPSVSSYAWINIRTTAASTVGGTITLASATPSGTLATVLEYRAVRTAGTGTACDASAFSGSPTYIAGGSSTYLAVTSVPGSPVASAITSPSGELRFCFDVRVTSTAANSYQGTTATVTWLFSAVSS